MREDTTQHTGFVPCNNCKTSIFDLHRTCPSCSYDLCLNCCREIRDGHLQGGGEEVIMEYVSRGLHYLHGGKEKVELPPETSPNCSGRSTFEWKPNEDGNIPCPPKDMNGCGDERCSCLNSVDDVGSSSTKSRKAASRVASDDNYLYCRRAGDIQRDDFKHFQWHWFRGEPVIVSNVLETTNGLSWEPLVMWRACRQMKHMKHGRHLDVKTIDCLDWCEILKLKDWPPSNLFEERLPRHGAEFICCLPFKEYTHPRSGCLNLPTKLPEEYTTEVTLTPGQHATIEKLKKKHMEQDQREFLGIVRLRMTLWIVIILAVDRVPGMQMIKNFVLKLVIKKSGTSVQELDKSNVGHDGNFSRGSKSEKSVSRGSESGKSVEEKLDDDESDENSVHAINTGNKLEGSNEPEGGALWDIFRRQDVPRLQEYLRHIHCCPLQQRIGKLGRASVRDVES
ncbi:hypothetical protein ACE6H2_016151 [Prunus campanulata]